MSDLNIDNSDLEDQGGNEQEQSGSDDNTRLQAQLSASSNESKLLNEVNKVLISDDFAYFQDISSKDNKMAERVVEKIAKLKGMDSDEVRSLLMANVKSQKSLTPYEIEQEVKKTIAKQDGEKALAKFLKETGIDKDKEINEEFMSTFEDYMQGREYTTANVKRFSKSAYRDLKEDNVKLFEKKKGEIEAQIINGDNGKQKESKKEGRQILKNSSSNDW